MFSSRTGRLVFSTICILFLAMMGPHKILDVSHQTVGMHRHTVSKHTFESQYTFRRKEDAFFDIKERRMLITKA